MSGSGPFGLPYIFNNLTSIDENPSGRAVLDRSNSGIVGSNPALGMDVCPLFSVLCRRVKAKAL
jgi:hypothetical protein